MVVKERVGLGDGDLVPRLPLPRLASAKQQDGRTSRVEREQDTEVARPRPEFLHVRMARGGDGVDKRGSQARPILDQPLHGIVDGALLCHHQRPVPAGEFIGPFDLPRHTVSLPKGPFRECKPV
jgi:hypothetical protein